MAHGFVQEQMVISYQYSCHDPWSCDDDDDHEPYGNNVVKCLQAKYYSY